MAGFVAIEFLSFRELKLKKEFITYYRLYLKFMCSFLFHHRSLFCDEKVVLVIVTRKASIVLYCQSTIYYFFPLHCSA